MNPILDTASNRARPSPTREDDAIAAALQAAENEGWNQRLARVRGICKWFLPPRRAGVRHSLKPR